MNIEADSLNCRAARAGCRAGFAGVRLLRARSRARDDGEDRPEVHGDSARPGAGEHAAAVTDAIAAALAKVVVGDPANATVTMGPVVQRTLPWQRLHRPGANGSGQ